MEFMNQIIFDIIIFGASKMKNSIEMTKLFNKITIKINKIFYNTSRTMEHICSHYVWH